MKILCIVLAIANLAMLLWEFRTGAIAQPKTMGFISDQKIILLEGESSNVTERVSGGN
jgi:hypothetical protein